MDRSPARTVPIQPTVSAADEAPSSAPELPKGWTEASVGGLATSRDPINGGIVDRAIVSGEWFAIANRPGVAPIEGLASRAEAFAALAKALANQVTKP